MDIIKDTLFWSLKSYMKLTTEEDKAPNAVTEEQWAELFALSSEHKIIGAVYDSVYELECFKASDDAAKNSWKSETLAYANRQFMNDAAFAVLYKKLIGVGIRPLVVKGLVCRSLYSVPHYRVSADEDLFIKPEEYKKACTVLLDCGYIFDKDEHEKALKGESHEVPFRNPARMITIELHLSLFPQDDEIFGKTNEWYNSSLDYPFAMEIEGITYYTLSPTVHFLYLCVHAFKHFVHSGFGIRQLMDIIMMGRAFNPEIDWEYVWDKLTEINADVLFLNLFSIGEYYFETPVESYGGFEVVYRNGREKSNIDIDELLDELLEAGTFGKSSMARLQSSLMTLHAVSGQDANVSKGKMSALFPSRKEMEGKFKYVEKCGLLLPVAWIHRIIKFASQKKADNGSLRDLNESAEIGKTRIQLLQKYKVIK